MLFAAWQSCKHESWITTAKYLMDDVPVLLSSDNMQNVKNVLASVFMSLPADFAEFIKWVAEIRREEDNSQTLSEEEKGRLRIKVNANGPCGPCCVCQIFMYFCYRF